ncbi:MAG: glutamine synthetase family protein [Oscillospiraceae bacterium]|nr:glutamine synthetase family protein [Oscillospiraceae bacterium]
MKYSKHEVMQYVREEEVKFIRLAFCDVFGRQKNISIMPSELPRAFEYGIAVDASAVAGFGGVVHSDLFLRPDPDTLALFPWRPETGRVIRMFCTITHPDGTPFENDPRTILKSAVAKAEAAGYRFSFGAEMEFYLFRLDEDGEPTNIPFDKAGYMDIAPDDKGENVRREICLTLEKMGIQPEGSHHEEGPGQNEIDFRYAEALDAADNAITFRRVVQTIAARNGLYADFSPKPLSGQPGSGMHINFSIRGKEPSSDLLSYTIAGLVDKIKDMTIFLNPTEASYLRLGSSKAPGYISWSTENRSQLIRIPAAFGEFRRGELRSPDPDTNPYLAYALMIEAGLYGIANRLTPPPAGNLNLFTASPEQTAPYPALPADRRQAAEAAAHSDFIRSCLPPAVIEAYCSL